jgi:hypothetical protein
MMIPTSHKPAGVYARTHLHLATALPKKTASRKSTLKGQEPGRKKRGLGFPVQEGLAMEDYAKTLHWLEGYVNAPGPLSCFAESALASLEGLVCTLAITAPGDNEDDPTIPGLLPAGK